MKKIEAVGIIGYGFVGQAIGFGFVPAIKVNTFDKTSCNITSIFWW